MNGVADEERGHDNEKIAMALKLLYETLEFSESRKEANRRKSGNIIYESTPGRS